MATGMIHDYPNTASDLKDTSFMDIDQEISTGVWQSQKASGVLIKGLMVSENRQEITKAALINLIANTNVRKKQYIVTDSAYGYILIWGINSSDISNFAVRLGNVSPSGIYGYCGTYNIGSDIFLEQGRIATEPTTAADGVHGFYVDQLLTTKDTGITYRCISAATGAAVWKANSGSFSPTFTASVPSDASMVKYGSDWHFTKVGNVYTLNGSARVAFSNGSTGDTFSLDLSQFMLNDFTSDDQANCVIGIVEFAGISDVDIITISSVDTTKKVVIDVTMLNPDINIKLGFTITFKLP